MTFSSLCEFLSATPVRQISILKGQKYPKTGPIRGYANALRQIQDLAVSGKPLAPDASTLEPHEQEVIGEMALNQWTTPAPTASKPSTTQDPMTVNGVEISVFPDLLLADSTGRQRQSGALKFYFVKSKELDAQVARWMASFIYQYKVMIEEDGDADPALCLIYDVRNDEYYEAGKSYKRLFQNIEGACQIIDALWNTL